MKWRKNYSLAIFLYATIFVACFTFCMLYIEKRKIILLLILFFLLTLLISLFVTSFKTWNEYLYMDEEKIWIKRTDKLTIWRFDEVTKCRIIRRPCWSSRAYYGIRIVTCSNPKPLVFEWNDKVENKLLEITKGKDVWKILHEAFK